MILPRLLMVEAGCALFWVICTASRLPSPFFLRRFGDGQFGCSVFSASLCFSSAASSFDSWSLLLFRPLDFLLPRFCQLGESGSTIVFYFVEGDHHLLRAENAGGT